MSDLQDRIQTATRTAMKARDKRLVAALRLVNAELKRVEVDERKALADADVIAVLTRMVKQRNDSRSQYEAAGRTDLAEQEAFEIDVVRSFMPAPLSEAELDALIDAAIADTGAAGMRDMGKVMGQLKGEVAGRADMGTVSAKVKARLSG
ncbi:MAG: GatB/YqeY domain-containing protein [Chloroflexota bacterium]|nr:GatB/YqeY domain-containing protein [Chloroflexota bacterium]